MLKLIRKSEKFKEVLSANTETHIFLEFLDEF